MVKSTNALNFCECAQKIKIGMAVTCQKACPTSRLHRYAAFRRVEDGGVRFRPHHSLEFVGGYFFGIILSVRLNVTGTGEVSNYIVFAERADQFVI